MQPQKMQLKSLNGQINELIKADKLDQTALDNLLAQKTKIQTSRMKNLSLIKHQMYELLDANQKAKFTALENKWEAEKHEKIDENNSVN